MGTLNIKVNNLDAVLSKIDSTVKNFEQHAQNELNGWANETVALAKQKAPKDEGLLARSINPNYGKLSASVTVAVNYAAYIEFGTKKFAASYVSILPPDWQAFAASYKGSAGGGSFEDFVMRITQWVKRKGFAAKVTKGGNSSKSISSVKGEESAAYAIALSIVRNGIKAQPYLFPSYAKTVKTLKDNLKALVK